MMSDARSSPLKLWFRKDAEEIHFIPLAHGMHDEELGDPDPRGGGCVCIYFHNSGCAKALIREECVVVPFPALWVTSVF